MFSSFSFLFRGKVQAAAGLSVQAAAKDPPLLSAAIIGRFL